MRMGWRGGEAWSSGEGGTGNMGESGQENGGERRVNMAGGGGPQFLRPRYSSA